MTCPACHSAPVPAGKVVCRDCWKNVPETIRAELKASRRASSNLPLLHDKTDRMARLERYQVAQSAVVTAAQAFAQAETA